MKLRTLVLLLLAAAAWLAALAVAITDDLPPQFRGQEQIGLALLFYHLFGGFTLACILSEGIIEHRSRGA